MSLSKPPVPRVPLGAGVAPSAQKHLIAHPHYARKLGRKAAERPDCYREGDSDDEADEAAETAPDKTTARISGPAHERGDQNGAGDAAGDWQISSQSDSCLPPGLLKLSQSQFEAARTDSLCPWLARLDARGWNGQR